MRLVTLKLAGEDLYVTRHALECWREHVCPMRGADWAEGFLQLVVALAGEECDRPAWVVGEETGGERYVVAGDFALIVYRGCVVTIIPRGGLPRQAREARNSAAAARRRGRTARRRMAPRNDRGARARRRELRAATVDDQLDPYTGANRKRS